MNIEDFAKEKVGDMFGCEYDPTDTEMRMCHDAIRVGYDFCKRGDKARDNKEVFCRGTESGVGVKEVLLEHGGNYEFPLSFKNTDALYFISPIGNCITIVSNSSTPLYRMVEKFYTEVQPLKNVSEEKKETERDGYYWYVSESYSCAYVVKTKDLRDTVDNIRYNRGNYFKLETEAQECADRINQMFKSRN